METESHADTHVKNEGIGAICYRTGLRLILSESGLWFHSALASKAERHQK